jgi:hypothetical protein
VVIATTTTAATATAAAAAAEAATATAAAATTAATATEAATATTAAAAVAAAATAAAATTVPAAAATAAAATTTTEATATTFLAGLGFVDAERTTVDVSAVQRLDRALGILLGCHFDESKTTRATGITVEHDLDVCDLAAVPFKGGAQGILGGLEGEVANVQSRSHRYLTISSPFLYRAASATKGQKALMHDSCSRRSPT